MWIFFNFRPKSCHPGITHAALPALHTRTQTSIVNGQWFRCRWARLSPWIHTRLLPSFSRFSCGSRRTISMMNESKARSLCESDGFIFIETTYSRYSTLARLVPGTLLRGVTLPSARLTSFSSNWVHEENSSMQNMEFDGKSSEAF